MSIPDFIKFSSQVRGRDWFELLELYRSAGADLSAYIEGYWAGEEVRPSNFLEVSTHGTGVTEIPVLLNLEEEQGNLLAFRRDGSFAEWDGETTEDFVAFLPEVYATGCTQFYLFDECKGDRLTFDSVAAMAEWIEPRHQDLLDAMRDPKACYIRLNWVNKVVSRIGPTYYLGGAAAARDLEHKLFNGTVEVDCVR